MTPWDNLLQRPQPEAGHFVQFYGTDDTLLTRNITLYLSEGLKRGEGALVIASGQHNEALVGYLRDAGADPEQAMRQKRLLFLDAQQTLDRFMVDGQPDQRRFERTLEAAMAQVESESGLRAYGEMVGVLWKDGRFSAAILLEQYWNEVLNRSSFNLFCGYPIDPFAKDFDPVHFDALLCAHTHLLPTSPNKLDVDDAMDRAMDEVLGSHAAGVRKRMKSEHQMAWAATPRAEGILFWLRNNLPEHADAIITRARQHYQAA